MTTAAAGASAAQPAPAQASARHGYVDAFRGLLMAHMALDHASLMFNAGRTGEELATAAPPPPGTLMQFLTRFTGVPVAPGFFFMAGFMVAMTAMAREARGLPHAEVTRRLVVRGLVLLAADALVMGLPRLAGGFYSFVVLSAIGASIIALALARDLPTRVLLPAALAVLAVSPMLRPWLEPLGLPAPLRAVLYEPVRTGGFRSLYPLVPWMAIVFLGFVAGRDAATRERPARLWLLLAAVSALLFLLIRLPAGYGNAYAHGGVTHLDFWFFAKYPPDLAFVTWSFAMVFLTLAALWAVTRSGMPALLRPFVIFGRVPFFFYIVHFYTLGLTMALVRTRTGLLGTYLVWLALLVVMIVPCRWYYRKKRERPNWLTRYL